MTTERMLEFLVLSRTLNFSRSAAKLYITQSALSKHVMDMEKELGVTLLDRTTHEVRLTEAGRILAQGTQSILEKYDSAVSRLRIKGLKTIGSVSIACAGNMVYEQLLVFTRRFMAKYPEIDVTVDVLPHDSPAALLETHDFLFSAFELQKLPSSIIPTLAFRDSAVLAIMHGDPIMFQRHVMLEDLSGKTLLLPYADELLCSYSAIRQLAEKLTSNQINILKVPTVESALTMVSLGKGVTVVPRHMLNNSMANTLTLDITTPNCVFDTYLYWDQARGNPAAKLMFEEFEFFLKSVNGEKA